MIYIDYRSVMLSDRSLMIVSSLGCLLSLAYYTLLPNTTSSTRSQIVIGVFSRLENFQQRKAVRATWKKFLPEGVTFNFILGDNFCPYHQLWRLSEENCYEWQLEVPSWLKDGESLSLLQTEKSHSSRNNKAYSGFSFRVMRFPIVFEGVGILRSALTALDRELQHSSVSIDIKDRYSGEILNSVTFNRTDMDTDRNSGFAFKMFRTKNLPTVDFDGILSLRINSSQRFKFPSKQCDSVYDYSLGRHGLVHINGLLEDSASSSSSILPFSKYSCPLVSLKYRVLDVVSLRRHYGARATQNSVEGQKAVEMRRLLDREEEDFNDLVFLPILDSTFNNSMKLKLYSEHIASNLDFDHLLLTDDTSFVFVNNVLARLEKMSSSSMLWWSDFELLKRTDDYGENYSEKFNSLTYPPVPRAHSMLLSRHQVSFIAQNSLYLKHFSSSLTSLGVWLSTIHSRRLQDEFWNMKNCQNISVFSEAHLACSNLSPADIKTVWNKLRQRHY